MFKEYNVISPFAKQFEGHEGEDEEAEHEEQEDVEDLRQRVPDASKCSAELNTNKQTEFMKHVQRLVLPQDLIAPSSPHRHKLMMRSGAIGSQSQTFPRLTAGSLNSRVKLNT